MNHLGATEILFFSLLFILIGIGVMRLAFQIKQRVSLQKMQLKISILIAKKLGVDINAIDEALKD